MVVCNHAGMLMQCSSCAHSKPHDIIQEVIKGCTMGTIQELTMNCTVETQCFDNGSDCILNGVYCVDDITIAGEKSLNRMKDLIKYMEIKNDLSK